jgi:hypothetical protein
MPKITVDELGPHHAPEFEISDEADEHLLTLDLGQARDLHTELTKALRRVGVWLET